MSSQNLTTPFWIMREKKNRIDIHHIVEVDGDTLIADFYIINDSTTVYAGKRIDSLKSQFNLKKDVGVNYDIVKKALTMLFDGNLELDIE